MQRVLTVVASIFGSSPVMPIEEHAEIAYQCASQLRAFFQAAQKGAWDEAASVQAEIDRLEHEADRVKKDIRLHLPKSLFMPVPRQDLLELLLVQDRIADRTRDVAGLVMIRRMQVPEPIAEGFAKFVASVLDAALLARESVRELDELYVSGFRGAEVELVAGMIERLDDIETDTDAQQVALCKAVYELEDTLDPVAAVFIYKLIEKVGDVADMAERVGRRLELLLAH